MCKPLLCIEQATRFAKFIRSLGAQGISLLPTGGAVFCDLVVTRKTLTPVAHYVKSFDTFRKTLIYVVPLLAE